MVKKITKETTLHQALKASPATAGVFDSYRMGCKACSGARFETVEWGARMHGVAVEELLKKLNATAPGGRKKKKTA